MEMAQKRCKISPNMAKMVLRYDLFKSAYGLGGPPPLSITSYKAYPGVPLKKESNHDMDVEHYQKLPFYPHRYIFGWYNGGG